MKFIWLIWDWPLPICFLVKFLLFKVLLLTDKNTAAIIFSPPHSLLPFSIRKKKYLQYFYNWNLFTLHALFTSQCQCSHVWELACYIFFGRYVVWVCSGCNYVLLCFEILRIRTQDLTLQGVCLLLIFLNLWKLGLCIQICI